MYVYTCTVHVHGLNAVSSALSDVAVEVVKEHQKAPVLEHYCSHGELHGIQGEHNSCYLDATLFGLFALSSEFDHLLTVPENGPQGEMERNIVSILSTGIVYPLRKCVCVCVYCCEINGGDCLSLLFVQEWCGAL